jgi:hypothetical protein
MGDDRVVFEQGKKGILILRIESHEACDGVG